MGGGEVVPVDDGADEVASAGSLGAVTVEEEVVA